MSILSDAVIQAAKQELGQHEEGGNNLGPAVAKYLASVGLQPPQPWCAAFVSFCVKAGVQKAGKPSAIRTSASATNLWVKNPFLRTQVPIAGSIFCIMHANGPHGKPRGHTGFVVSVDSEDPDLLHTLEGNTSSNLQGAASRDGDSVCLRTRKRSEINLGFLEIR